jgi:hypothetical protein
MRAVARKSVAAAKPVRPEQALPVRGQTVMLICKNSSCLGYCDAQGRWRQSYNARELTDVLAWVDLRLGDP